MKVEQAENRANESRVALVFPGVAENSVAESNIAESRVAEGSVAET